MRYFGLFFFLLINFSAIYAQPHHIDSLKFINSAAPIPDHPRILLLAGEENNIKKAILVQRILSEVHKQILLKCDSMLLTKPVERILFGVRLLAKSRECLNRVFHLSYAWRMTHERKYLNRAEQELLAVSNFSDWNPDHYLDVTEMTMAVAIGYDWLYHDLSEKSRSIIKEAIKKKGIATSFDPAYPNYRKWLSVTNNWNQVCNAGRSFGALAVYEDDPALAEKVINRTIASIQIAMIDNGPDGAFAEGYTYWSYGTTFNVMFLNAIEKVFKTDFGLNKIPGFLKTAAYLENMIGPTGKNFNYSDASETSTLQPAMFWFASKLEDPLLLWNERIFLTKEKLAQNTDRLLPALMLWGQNIDIEKISAPKNRIWTGAGKNPVALIRSSWTDPNAIFVGIKGGSPSVTHGHMDAGSFVLEADGIRWAKDFGFQEYTALELKNIDLWANKQNGQRWEIFRYNNFSHNTLTFNDSLQRVDGYAPITNYSENLHFTNAVTDISSIYKGQVKKAQRGIALMDGQYVVVSDEIENLNKDTKVRWVMLTSAKVKLNGNQAELIQNGKKLIISIPNSADISIKTWTTNPPHDYDDPNPDTTLVGFETVIPAGKKETFQVFLIPGSGKIKATNPLPPLKDWPK
ncbi:heparinase II/III family protein [Dyadobacter subterraneus]|uniref:Heparinase II/III family protein n=1 Tax=Dyadobacter subterraneus TaxID=2773304 RepID=A0ABR9W7S0_9BACT|nr:heparinase II/III family protein [Dyadobacter subterraneus]MBE9461516.1 heparinase II/III family protein [Dyadobacter subterraneus]